MCIIRELGETENEKKGRWNKLHCMDKYSFSFMSISCRVHTKYTNTNIKEPLYVSVTVFIVQSTAMLFIVVYYEFKAVGHGQDNF